MHKLCLILSLATSISLLAHVEPIEYKKVIEEDSISLSVMNLLPAPLLYEISCDTASFQGEYLMQSDSSFVEVMRVENFLENDSSSLSDYITVGAKIGDPNAVHDDGFEYSFPFEKGKRFTLIQGYHGKFSHNKDHSRFALDFKMPEGSSIHAARGGVVCYYQEHFNEGGRDREKYINKNNRVMILHDDGTIGYYNHLKKDGVLVELGQKVERGDLIGLSGNTGFTTTPHLHFVVRSGDMSVPFKMKGLKKQKKGRKYGH